jgi:hypothetical protein
MKSPPVRPNSPSVRPSSIRGDNLKEILTIDCCAYSPLTLIAFYAGRGNIGRCQSVRFIQWRGVADCSMSVTPALLHYFKVVEWLCILATQSAGNWAQGAHFQRHISMCESS